MNTENRITYTYNIEGHEIPCNMSTMLSNSIDNKDVKNPQPIVLPTMQEVIQKGQYANYIGKKMSFEEIYPDVFNDFDSDTFSDTSSVKSSDSGTSDVSILSLQTNPEDHIFSYDHLCSHIENTRAGGEAATREEYGSSVRLNPKIYKQDCWWQLCHQHEFEVPFRVTKPKLRTETGEIVRTASGRAARGQCHIASISAAANFESAAPSLFLDASIPILAFFGIGFAIFEFFKPKNLNEAHLETIRIREARLERLKKSRKKPTSKSKYFIF